MIISHYLTKIKKNAGDTKILDAAETVTNHISH